MTNLIKKRETKREKSSITDILIINQMKIIVNFIQNADTMMSSKLKKRTHSKLHRHTHEY